MAYFPFMTLSVREKDLPEGFYEELLRENNVSWLALMHVFNNPKGAFMTNPVKIRRRKGWISMKFFLRSVPRGLVKEFAFFSQPDDKFHVPASKELYEELVPSRYFPWEIYLTALLDWDDLKRTYELKGGDSFLGSEMTVSEFFEKRARVKLPENALVRIKLHFEVYGDEPFVVLEWDDEDFSVLEENRSEYRLNFPWRWDMLDRRRDFSYEDLKRYVDVVDHLKRVDLKPLEDALIALLERDFPPNIEDRVLSSLHHLVGWGDRTLFLEDLIKNYEPKFLKLLDLTLTLQLSNSFHALDEYHELESLLHVADTDEEEEEIKEGMKSLEEDLSLAEDFLLRVERELTDRSAKAMVMRKRAWFIRDPERKISVLEQVISMTEDKSERNIAYYELINAYVQSGDLTGAEEQIKRALEEFPEEDAFYEQYGHLGMIFLQQEDNEEEAMRCFRVVYEWLNYRMMREDLPDDWIPSNFLFFMARYGELLREEGELENSLKVLDTGLRVLERYLPALERESRSIKGILEEYTAELLFQTSLTRAEIEGEDPEEALKKVKNDVVKRVRKKKLVTAAFKLAKEELSKEDEREDLP